LKRLYKTLDVVVDKLMSERFVLVLVLAKTFVKEKQKVEGPD
jgi:hypothetical protein